MGMESSPSGNTSSSNAGDLAQLQQDERVDSDWGALKERLEQSIRSGGQHRFAPQDEATIRAYLRRLSQEGEE